MQFQEEHIEPLPVEEKDDITVAIEAAANSKEQYGIRPGYFLFYFILGWLATVVICLFVRSII
jgi:hypothetical protein